MKVLIVDDHPLIHEVMGEVVRSAFGECEIFEAKTLFEAFVIVSDGVALDLVLLDLGLPDCTGIESLVQFRAKLPHVSIVIISADQTKETILAALNKGAAGYIPKTLMPKIMISALKLVSSGGTYIPQEVISGQLSHRSEHFHDKPRLTVRQNEILRLLVKGHDNRTIAEQLQISEGTVKQHLHALFIALGVTSRAQAVVAAMRFGVDDATAEY
ncbi:MAG: response regulator [Burkholderiales bacterium]